MSSNKIGIKLADGSFYPILEEGVPQTKTLELTTARNDQTTVQLDLYKTASDVITEADYVDTLLVENLLPRPKETPTLNLKLSLDENDVLSAEIEDAESGEHCATKVSLINLSESERTIVPDYSLNDSVESEPVDADSSEIESSEPQMENDMSDDLNLDGFDDMDSLLADNSDTLSDISFTENDLNTEIDVPVMDDDTVAETEEPALEDDPFAMDDVVAETEEPALDDSAVEEEPFAIDDAVAETEETVAEDDPFAIEEPVFDDSADETLSEDSLSDSEIDIPVTDDIVAEENAERDSILDDLDTTIPDVDLSEPAIDDTVAMDETSSSDEIVEESFPDFGDIDTSLENDLDTELNTDLDTELNTDLDTEIDLNSDLDIPSTDTDEYKFEEDKDFEDSMPKPEMSYSNSLYDSETFDENDEGKKKKVLLAVLICGLCALVCVGALLLFLLLGKPKANTDKKVKEPKQKVEKVKPAKVEPAKPDNESAKEDEIIIVKSPVVEPAGKKNDKKTDANVISYTIKWGDTLWDISQTYYKTPWLYQFIADYNQIPNPDLIISGSKIDIPPR